MASFETGICHASIMFMCRMSDGYATLMLESFGSLKRIMKRNATTRA